MLISRISLRISGATVGRPPRRRDFHRQYDLNPARCHLITVSGFTIAKAPIGQLGFFASGGVAKKEHSEFSSNIDLIDVLPPGLYEATFEARGADTANADLAVGQWVMRCEQRTLDDIRAMGGNSPEDERRFATAARVSEINLARLSEIRPALDQVHGDAADRRHDAQLASAASAI